VKYNFDKGYPYNKNSATKAASSVVFNYIIITLLPFFIEMLQYDWL